MVGIQLDLFADPYRSPDSPAVQDLPSDVSDPPAPDVLVVRGPQLDLFAERHLRLERARRTWHEARAGDAVRELGDLLHRYPGDRAIAAELELARDLDRRLRAIDAAAPGERPRMLSALARSAPVELRAVLLRRAAAELCGSDPAALLEGKAASVLLLEAGDLDGAHAAAAAAVGASGRARFVAYLADIELRRELPGRAREHYREALALDPQDVDWEAICDDEVRSLPDIARNEFELEDGVAWSAPVGVVLGVLPLGRAPVITADVGAAAGAQSGCGPVDQARRFLAALVRDRSGAGGALIDARRQMRARAPLLLAAYLESK